MTHEGENIKRLLTEAVPLLTPPMDRVGAVAARVRRRRQRLIGSSALAVAVAIALGVGGAQMITGDHAPPRGTAADSGGQRWTSCTDAAPEIATPGFKVTAEDAAALPRLGGDFTPDAVVICGQEAQRSVGGGEDLMATERRSNDVAALVTALRLPDEPETVTACTADAELLPWLALVDADGRWVRPDIPVGRCGKSRPEVREALGALSLTTVASWKVAVLVSAEAAAAGCSQGWKAELSLATEENLTRRGVLPEPFPAGRQIRLCVFEVLKSDPGTGNFVHGTVLPVDRRTAIEHALKAAGSAEPCSARASRFAVLRATTGEDPGTYVELDGCHRIMVTPHPDAGGPAIAQGDAALAELIDKS
jgi:hypothetical protein